MSSARGGSRAGEALSPITDDFRRRLGIAARIVPMSDDPVRTRLETERGLARFPGLFRAPALRARGARDRIRRRGDGAAAAANSWRRSPIRTLRAVVICPSNPFISIEPILALPGLRAGACAPAPRRSIAVSPIIAGRAVKGPTAKMMRELGHRDRAPPRSRAAMAISSTLFVVDARDRAEAASLDAPIVPAQTLMQTLADREALARAVLAAADAGAGAMKRVWAVVPVKELGAAKQRLAGALDAALRRALALAMLEDVLEALAGARGLAGIIVVDRRSERPPRSRARYGADRLARGRRARATPRRSWPRGAPRSRARARRC